MLYCQAPHCMSQKTGGVSVLGPGEKWKKLGLTIALRPQPPETRVSLVSHARDITQGGPLLTWALPPEPRTRVPPLPEGDWVPRGKPWRTWTCFSRIRRLLKVRFPSVQYLAEGGAGRWHQRPRPEQREAPTSGSRKQEAGEQCSGSKAHLPGRKRGEE